MRTCRSLEYNAKPLKANDRGGRVNYRTNALTENSVLESGNHKKKSISLRHSFLVFCFAVNDLQKY